MRYISNCITDSYGEKTFGVTNLKTGREDWYDEYSLMTLIEEGTEIKGAELKEGVLIHTVLSSESSSMKAAKLSLLTGASFALDDDFCITKLEAEAGSIIHLHGMCRDIVEDLASTTDFTIVLDDKAECSWCFLGFSKTSYMHHGARVKIDLREVTDEVLAFGVYNAYVTDWPIYEFDPIIDDESRKRRLLSLAESDRKELDFYDEEYN